MIFFSFLVFWDVQSLFKNWYSNCINCIFNEELLYRVAKYNFYVELLYYRMLKKREEKKNEMNFFRLIDPQLKIRKRYHYKMNSLLTEIVNNSGLFFYFAILYFNFL